MSSEQVSKLARKFGGPGRFAAHVLLVEHDADVAAEIVDFLGRRDISCRSCATVAQASVAFAERRPDLVVLNAAVSAGDGVVFCLQHAPNSADVHWLLLDASARVRCLPYRLLGDRVSIVDLPVSLRYVYDFILMMSAIRRQARDPAMTAASPRAQKTGR